MSGSRNEVNCFFLGKVKGNSFAAPLTCQYYVKLAYRSERLIEPTSSWFLAKCPSGQLELNCFVKRGIGNELFSTFSDMFSGASMF